MNKMLLMGIGVCVAVSCLFAAGCISPDVPVQTDDPVLTVTVEKEGMMIPANALITFILPANPTTGYSWKIMESGGLTVKEEYKAAPVPEGWTGGGGCQYYTLTAEKAGTYTFKAGYERAWETDTAPIYTVTQTLVFSDAENEDLTGEDMLIIQFDGVVNPKAGETVKISTAGNPTTGYYWQASSKTELKLLKDEFNADAAPGLVGAGGTYAWYVTADEAGTYQFEASCQRSGQDPVNLFFFDLTFI